MTRLPHRMRNTHRFSYHLLQKVQMKKIKLDMYCIVLLLFFKTVASSHVLTTDCSPSIKNITCDCSNISLSCHGVQEDYLDVVELVTNISDSFGLEKNFSVDITIENIVLNPNSSFKNVTVSFLKLGSGLSHLPDTMFYGVGDSLHVLNLSYNNFATVPSDALMTLKQLHTLDLSHNNITTISKNAFKGLDNLRAMNLEYNIISVIESDAFLNLPLLQMLHLGHNALVSLNSSAFKGLLSLNQLSIAGNGFDFLKSESFMMLTALKILHADTNSLMDLENIQMDSTKLQELSVQHCAIEGLLKRDSLKSLPNLTSADLSYNNITEIQSFALTASFQLKHLNLSYNNIRKLQENAFCDLFNLITLDLQHNEIQIVPKTAFYNLTRLRHLNLNNNKLHAFLCHYTASLFSLESIHLENNKIKMINSGAFIYSQNLTELKLAGNDLKCSCIIYDFAKYLLNHTHRFKNANIIKCSSSKSGKQNIIEVDFNLVHCKSEQPCLSPSGNDRISAAASFENPTSNKAVITTFNSTYMPNYEDSFPTESGAEVSSNYSSSTSRQSSHLGTSSFNGISTTNNLSSETDEVLPTITAYITDANNSVARGKSDSTLISHFAVTKSTTVSRDDFRNLTVTFTKLKTQKETATSHDWVKFFTPVIEYDSPFVNIKHYSLVNGNLCMDWSVGGRIPYFGLKCILSYAYDKNKGKLTKHIACPLRHNEIIHQCFKTNANNVLLELCVKITALRNILDTVCITEKVLSTVPGKAHITSPSASATSQTSNTDGTSPSNLVSASTDFSTLLVTAYKENISIQNYSDDTSISHRHTTQLHSAETFSGDMTVDNTDSADVQITTHSNEFITLNYSANTHIPQSHTISLTADNQSSTVPLSEISSSGSSDAYHNENHSSALNYPDSFPVSQSHSSALVTSNQSIAVYSNVSFSNDFPFNSTDSGEVLITAHYENYSYTANYSDTHPVSQSYAVTSVKTPRPMKPFNITYFNIQIKEGKSVVIEWIVNRREPHERCMLKLSVISNNTTETEKNFGCKDNSYTLKSVELDDIYEICLIIIHLMYDNVSVCRHHVFEPSAIKLTDHSSQTYSLVAVISLLIIVMCFIIVLAVRNILKSKKTSDSYSVTKDQTEDFPRMNRINLSSN